jgi:hypothetical protein
MYWKRTAAEIAAAWQAEIENKLEAGATPLLVAGAPGRSYDGTTTLLAYQTMAARRGDMSAPLLAAGGASALWLGMLLAPADGAAAVAPAVVFAGADPATYLAGVATLSSGALAPPAPVATGTPPSLALWLSPRLQPGAPAPWEALPFAEVGERPQPMLAQSNSPLDPAADPIGDWIAWGAMLLALCLVLSALLI